MFDMLNIRTMTENSGFALVLNPSRKKNDGIQPEQTSGNIENGMPGKPTRHCILSLIAALSVHSHVIHVEMNTEVTVDSINAQWITQSKVVDYRPFFDVGLTGKDQIVSVSDTGLDTDNCYFQNGSGDEGNFFDGNWDLTRRKIVKYDNTFADDWDQPYGHGTHVSGIIAGHKFDGNSEVPGYADGVARDAKIAFFDMRKGSSGLSAPSAKNCLSPSTKMAMVQK